MLEQMIWRLEAVLGFEIKEALWGNKQDQGGVRVSAPEVLFLALHKFVDVLVKKSCFKAALEINKLLLKLDPINDPVGALFCIDYVSICARDYKFFLHFAHEFCNEVYKVNKYTLIYLPNIIYSCALIKYIMEQDEQQSQQIKDKSAIDWKILLNSSSVLLESNSSDILKCAIIFYPQLLSLLIEKCEFNKKNQKLQETMQNWPLELDQIRIQKFRESDSEKENQMQLQSINKMCEIYVERCAQCWRWNSSPKLIQWISNSVEQIINDSQEGKFKEIKITGQLNQLPFGIERYKGLIKSRFSPDEAQIDFNNIQDNMQMNQQPQMQQGQHFVDPNSGFFNSFLQSLLPWYQVPNGQQQQQQQGEDQNDDEDEPEEEWEDWEDFN